MQDLNTPTEQSGIKLFVCELNSKQATGRKIRDSWISYSVRAVRRFVSVCGWVRVHVCKRAFKCVHVCRCALGLYHHRDNKVSRVICKLSGENFPAEALISFLLQFIVP